MSEGEIRKEAERMAAEDPMGMSVAEWTEILMEDYAAIEAEEE